MLVLWIYSVILILFSFSRSSSLDSSDIFPYPSEISPESAAEVPPEFPSESLLSDVSLFSVASDDGDASDISWLDDGAVDDDDDGNIENLIVGDSGRRCQLGKKRSDESCSTSQETQLQSPSIDLFQDDTATFLQGEDIACPERKHLCCDGPPEAQSLPIVYRLIRQCVQVVLTFGCVKPFDVCCLEFDPYSPLLQFQYSAETGYGRNCYQRISPV